MRVRIQTDSFDPDFFGQQEFVSLPTLGSSVVVMDRNSNIHFLKVVTVRQQGWKPDSEVADLLRQHAEAFGVVLVCEIDVEWRDQSREADQSAAE